MPHSLPIDATLPELLGALRSGRFAVLEAPAGSGKTTRVPLALSELVGKHGEVLVTEPRRLAARLAAEYVARSLGQRVGEEIGYSVRFEDKRSRRTRVRYVTEGVLLQQLLREPDLPGVSAVILDEFHERHLETDQLLVLVRGLCERHPTLRLVVMSATLETTQVARFLRDCPVITSDGQMYPVEVRYDTELADRPLERRVALAVKESLRRNTDGHVLVFLPGAREIAQAEEQLARSLSEQEAAVLPLHGELPLEAQSRAVEPSQRRKVVLSTNVAESSLTIDGVRTVVDSGLANTATFDAWTGQRRLELTEVSQASAQQRAGRAGRTGPGEAVRLYSESNFRARETATPPEIQRSDLTELVLGFFVLGLDPASVEWLDAPRPASLTAASNLLRRLGALDAERSLTPLGKRLARFPLPPRLARVLVDGEARGIGHTAARAVAVLSVGEIEAPPRSGSRPDRAAGLSDLEERLDRFLEAEHTNFRPSTVSTLGLAPRRVSEVQRTFAQLLRYVSPDDTKLSTEDVDHRLRQALLNGFPDCVARRQSPASDQLILANGTKARLSRESVVHEAPLLLVLNGEERALSHRVLPSHGRSAPSGLVRWVSAVDPDWLLESQADWVNATETLEYNPAQRRVETLCRLQYGSIVLDESREPAAPSEQAARLLLAALIGKKAAVLGKDSTLEQWLERARLLQRHLPNEFRSSIPSLDELLEVACRSATSWDQVAATPWVEVVLGHFTESERRLLRDETPDAIRLPSGRALTLHYEAGKPPWVQSRLQDFFGMTEGPRLCRQRVAITLHLLAPNQRAVQVTADLAGFWERHYSEVRKELRRRYPKHAWPEDGRTASPPKPGHRTSSS